MMGRLRKSGFFRREKAYYFVKARSERNQLRIFASLVAVCSGKPEKHTMFKEVVGGSA